jgi:hypothetical protein
MFDHHPYTGEDAVAEFFPYRELFAFGLFLGCVVNTPPGS